MYSISKIFKAYIFVQVIFITSKFLKIFFLQYLIFNVNLIITINFYRTVAKPISQVVQNLVFNKTNDFIEIEALWFYKYIFSQH